MAFSKEKAHERAERYAAKGQHDKAAREYQQIVDNDPKDIRAWLMLADCLVRCGDAPRAIGRYMQVAQYYVEQRQPQKALAVYRQVLNLDQARIDVQLKVAAINMQLGRIPDAIALYERIGQVQLQAGQIGKALEIFKLVADADPTAVSRRLRLAELYSREKRTQDAVDAFRAAGDQLLVSDRKADYVRVAERLLYHDANDKGTIRQLARVYLELGDPRRALMKLNALLHADPSDRLGIELLAETFLALGKLDKALSVIGELARELRQHDPMREDAIRVLRRGLEWSPGHPEFTAALDELLEGETAASGTPAIEVPSRDIEIGAPEEIADVEEIGDSDVLELDAEDVEMEEEPEPGAPARPVGRAGSFTASVMSEARHEPADPDNLTDFDKILFEARVYIKYRLFDHALDHVDAALEQEPDHIGALSLRARAYTELGRLKEAADTHLQVARRVSAADPKLAREHLAAALSAAPDHDEARRLLRTLGDGAPPAAEKEGDSGMFDVAVGGEGEETFGAVYDPDEEELTPVSGVEIGEPDSGDDFRIDVQDEEPAAASSARMPVENRFGISHSGPLPEADEPRRAGTPARGMRARPASDSSASPPSRTPPAGFVARPPSELERSPASHTPPAGFVARPPAPGAGAPAPIPTPAWDASASGSGAHEAAEDVVAALERGVREAASSGLVPHDPLAESAPIPVDDAIEVEFDDDELEPVDIPRGGAPEPATAVPEKPAGGARPAAAAPAKSWPDLSDDLAEIRFFVDQGLDDDAEAAMAELRRRYPGHPELEAAAAPAEAAPSALNDEAAKPLVDVEEDTSDEDDYLAAIFGESDAAPAKSSPEPELRARLEDEAQDVDPQTAYDLGLAYREMGLVDDAIAQFQIAAKDDGFRSRALVMIGTLRVHRGETDRAVDDLREAVRLATNPDESSEANYELGLLYQKIGNTAAAKSQLQAVAKGFRDRDERLTQLGG